MKREDNLKFSIITVCYNSEAMRSEERRVGKEC